MRRILQRLRTALMRPRVAFIYHASYARTVSGVPIDPARADEILAFLLDQGLIRQQDGQVADAATGEPVRWRPTPMVVPVSGRLQALVNGPSYERALELARGALRAKLALSGREHVDRGGL